jgi:hypothetical protein
MYESTEGTNDNHFHSPLPHFHNPRIYMYKSALLQVLENRLDSWLLSQSDHVSVLLGVVDGNVGLASDEVD